MPTIVNPPPVLGLDPPKVALSPWDVLYVGPARTPLPGICTIKGSRKRKKDQKSPNGTDGGNTTDLGWLQGEFDITLLLTDVTQLALYQSRRQLLFPKPYKPPPPAPNIPLEGISPLSSASSLNPELQGIGLDESALTGIGLDVQGLVPVTNTTPQPAPTMVPVVVSHPAFAIVGVKAVYFYEEGLPEASEKGIEIRFKASEFLKPGTRNVTSTAQGTGTTDLTTLASGAPAAPQMPSATDAGP